MASLRVVLFRGLGRVLGPLLALSLPLLTGCGASPVASVATTPMTKTVQAPPDTTPIKLGVLADISGAFVPTGVDIHLGVDLAVQQINSAGGVTGRRVETVYVDPRGDPSAAVEAATQLVQNDNVDVLLGGISSAECLSLQALAPKLGIVYMPLAGCQNREFSSQSCNKNSFRVWPAGEQLIYPVASYAVRTYGKRWAIIYQDYAFGQSQLQTWDNALHNLGAELTVKIAMPLNEANVTPYVSKVPTDGSIDGLLPVLAGTDLVRTLGVLRQFGITEKLPLSGISTVLKEYFGGKYPDEFNGVLHLHPQLPDPIPGNTFDDAYHKAFQALASSASEASIVGLIGGAANATVGDQSYDAYISVTALKQAMTTSGFASRADTDKLIDSLANLSAPQSADFPAGPLVMSRANHQGRTAVYVAKVNGQRDDILDTIPADQLPTLEGCQIPE